MPAATDQLLYGQTGEAATNTPEILAAEKAWQQQLAQQPYDPNYQPNPHSPEYWAARQTEVGWGKGQIQPKAPLNAEALKAAGFDESGNLPMMADYGSFNPNRDPMAEMNAAKAKYDAYAAANGLGTYDSVMIPFQQEAVRQMNKGFGGFQLAPGPAGEWNRQHTGQPMPQDVIDAQTRWQQGGGMPGQRTGWQGGNMPPGQQNNPWGGWRRQYADAERRSGGYMPPMNNNPATQPYDSGAVPPSAGGPGIGGKGGPGSTATPPAAAPAVAAAAAQSPVSAPPPPPPPAPAAVAPPPPQAPVNLNNLPRGAYQIAGYNGGQASAPAAAPAPTRANYSPNNPFGGLYSNPQADAWEQQQRGGGDLNQALATPQAQDTLRKALSTNINDSNYGAGTPGGYYLETAPSTLDPGSMNGLLGILGGNINGVGYPTSAAQYANWYRNTYGTQAPGGPTAYGQ
jgi:hypothetical protein